MDSDTLSRIKSELKAYRMLIDGIIHTNKDIIADAINILSSIGIDPPHIPDDIMRERECKQ